MARGRTNDEIIASLPKAQQEEIERMYQEEMEQYRKEGLLEDLEDKEEWNS